MAETAKKISMIPAKVQYDRNVKLSEKKMKVAAYCRVSTELEEQDSSYEAQVEYYTSKISENENWKNAGIYADDGKSGTNTKKRADFNAMIQDALAGKIDMINSVIAFILDNLREPKSFDMFMRDAFRRFNIEMNDAQFALLGFTMRSYLIFCENSGIVSHYFADDLMMWKSL